MNRNPNHDIPPVAAELEKLRSRLGINNAAQFHRTYLSSYMSYSVWHRFRKGEYKGDNDKTEASCRKAIDAITSMLDLQERADTSVQNYIELDIFAALNYAVEMAHNRKNNKRGVIFKADTGGGKSTWCAQLKARYGATVVEASETWRKSYMSSCADICAAFGMPGPWKSASDAAASLLNHMRSTTGVLAIDEANSFGPQTCNLLKLILNQTSWTVCIATLPFFFEQLTRKSWAEAKQMIRRSVVLVAEDLTAADVAKLCGPMNIVPDDKAVAFRAIAKAANKFGLIDRVCEIRDELADLDNITISDVTEAITAVSKLKEGSK